MPDRDENYIRHRLQELADRAYNGNRYVYTDFLGMSELAIYHAMAQELSFVPSGAFGGTDTCERQMVRFGSEEMCGYPEEYPIRLLKVEAVQEKFADTLTHRDFLGSVLGVGLEREKVGDIFLRDNAGYLFVHADVSDFIRENLTFVKHTKVRVSELTEIPEELAPKLREENLVVSGNRIDSILARLYHLSREEAQRLVQGEQIFVNGKSVTQVSKALKEGDVVSVRHHGRFRFAGESGRTKKDRLYVKVEVYV
ncbi:MAG: RNA-binding protein [Eubacterium sp.]|nr:RNA-binding protein [Eubacterium sp.]